MGFRVENYSLNELHRIAVPGAVAPSLFWALPVGDWNPGELEEVWRWFTEHQSECNDFGLLLVKEMGRREAERNNVSLESVGAKLSDLMPSGAERFVRSAYQGDSPRILVLSGGYPQPGWGVLVEWRHRDVQHFEALIERTTRMMRGEHSTNVLDVFRQATKAFHRLRAVRSRPVMPDLTTVSKNLRDAEKAESLIRDAESAFQANHPAMLKQKILAAKQVLNNADWLNIEATTLASLEELQQAYNSAAIILAVPEEIIAGEIAPKIDALLADSSKRQTAYQDLATQELKHAMGACLHLARKGVVGVDFNFSTWAEQTRAECQPKLTDALSSLRQEVASKLATHRGITAQREYEHAIALKEWTQKSREARDSFHGLAAKAVELQWQLGPQFLVAFEKVCRQEGSWVSSVPWDPARMVGWKIMASEVKLYSRDLQIAARELAPNATGDSPTNGQAVAVADGSYFTDYVHHIAISKPGFSPRAVTRDLLVRLLRPAEMMNLIQTHTDEFPTATDAPLLAEELLHAFGWRQADEVREKPLAGCIKGSGDSVPAIAGDLSGNDLRIVLESFCKDIVDVVIAQLGYSHADIWGAIDERIPDYRPSSQIKDWNEEVRGMTVGGAVMLLPALGALAFPEQAESINEFTNLLRELAEVLNRSSHHREGKPLLSEAPSEAPVLIRKLLGKAEEIVGDLPWHLDARFIYGEQPKVLSGEAWSHGSPTPRLLRVIVWTGASPGSHVTFWNKERRNPVVPDPVFIVRPRKRE